MQIFKRVKYAQNMVEFIFVFPMLIFLTLVIFEIAFFWQEVNAIYNLNAEINANLALLDYNNMQMGSRCTAAEPTNTNSAISIFLKKQKMISLTNPGNSFLTVVNGQEPFSLYEYTAGAINGDLNTPQLKLWIDCRNPFEDGIITQIEFYHKTLIMEATIPRFDKPEGIVIIPKNIFIASPKLNTIRHY